MAWGSATSIHHRPRQHQEVRSPSPRTDKTPGRRHCSLPFPTPQLQKELSTSKALRKSNRADGSSAGGQAAPSEGVREGQLSHPSPPRHHFILDKPFGENPHPGTCCIFHAAEGATGQAAEETQRRDERKQLLHSLFSPHFHPHPLSFPTQKFPPSAPLQAPRAILLAPPQRRPRLQQPPAVTFCRACTSPPAAAGGWSRCREGRGRWRGG